MKEWKSVLSNCFDTYYNSFNGLKEDQQKNFEIKYNHSYRVAELAEKLAEGLFLNEDEVKTAYFIGFFHDIGRFGQLEKYGTFSDSKSIDHAKYSVQVIEEEDFLNIAGFDIDDRAMVNTILVAVENHNKLSLPKLKSEQEYLFAKLIRDADKLDILKVLTGYYSNRNSTPNHTLTWELPKGTSVSEKVAKEILAGKMVSKAEVVSEIDVKIMQMSWVYDINFRSSFEYLLSKRFLEIIYGSLPKNDIVIEIYRRVKMHVENKILNH